MEHKEQHWIPKSYLGAWCNPECPANHEPYVWRFSKDGATVQRKAPKSIFWESDIYTIPRADGIRNLTLEHGLSELESRFATIRREKLANYGNLDAQELKYVLLFVAAMHARTAAIRNHWQQQWSNFLKLMDGLAEGVEATTPEQRERIIRSQPIAPSPPGRSLTHDQVHALAQRPLQHMLRPVIAAEARRFAQMSICVFCTDFEPGFIASDAPCVWFDPEAYKRPPLYRTPALRYETIEITLPISPTQMIVLSWHDQLQGYKKITQERVLDELNTRTRFECDEFFVVRRNTKKDAWFDPGGPPEGGQ